METTTTTDVCADVESRECEKELSKMSPFEIKNSLIELAEADTKGATRTLLNAGRGNPNWIASVPREAFYLLGRFALDESKRMWSDPIGISGSPSTKGVADRFLSFLEEHSQESGAKLLHSGFDYLVNRKGCDPDAVAYEWCDGVTGDHYPTPDRILKYTEILVRDYLAKEMGNNAGDTPVFDLFATEGGTAAMCYVFDTLQQNRLLKAGDKIAIMTPIFTPYLEIPGLDRFKFDVVKISANAVEKNGYHDWQYPDSEINKLRDKSIRLLCVVNPSNPPSYALSQHSRELLVDIVKKDNPGLMIVTDDVYGTFVKDFRSLMYDLPRNTMCVYSFSKYFGATGWRLATVSVGQDNIFDEMIAKLPASDKAELNSRYGSLALDPSAIRFIDRMVADSRMVALNHTAGLSTPQQIMMSMFAVQELIDDENVYRQKMQSIISARLNALWETTGFTLLPDPLRAGYYSEIDLMVWATKFYGEDFAKYLNDNYEPLDVVVRLAHETAVVLLNGDGFDGPKWSVRASLANLNEPDYLKIGKAIREILDSYYHAYQQQKA